MTLPFTATFIPTGKEMTVEAITETSSIRFFWVRSKHGVLVKVPAIAFTGVRQ